MRMYGRENTDVVKPTNAVSATRKTLKGSIRKLSWNASSGPRSTTRTVSAAAAASVQKLTIALIVGATGRWPTSARSSAPATGRARTKATSITRSSPHSFGFLELLEVLEVEAVELLADLEEEHAED